MKQLFTVDVEKNIGAAVEFADTLKKKGKVGEFYICGYLVERFPEKVKKIAEHHIIGGHGYYHEDFARLDARESKILIRKTIYIFRKNNLDIQGWRFPGLSYSNFSMNAVVKAGLYDSSIKDSVWRTWGKLAFIRNWMRNLLRGIITLPIPYSVGLIEKPWSYADLNEENILSYDSRIILHCYKLGDIYKTLFFSDND